MAVCLALLSNNELMEAMFPKEAKEEEQEEAKENPDEGDEEV